jgi:hypothetical protein
MAFLFDALSKLGEIINPQGPIDYTLPGNFPAGGEEDVCLEMGDAQQPRINGRHTSYNEEDPAFRKNMVEIMSKIIEAHTGHPPQNTHDFKIMMFSITMIKGGFFRKSWWIPVNHPLAIYLQNHARYYHEWFKMDALHSSSYGQVYVYADDTMKEMFRTLFYMFEDEGVKLENFISDDEEEDEEEEEEEEAQGDVEEGKWSGSSTPPPLPTLPPEENTPTSVPTYSVSAAARQEGSKKAD